MTHSKKKDKGPGIAGPEKRPTHGESGKPPEKLTEHQMNHQYDDIQAALTRTYDEAEWAWIKPHSDRQIVIVVDAFLDLMQVGESIAKDQSAEVQKWIDQNLLTKPTAEQMSRWDSNPSERFLCLIVQPYILIQDLQKTKLKH